MANSNRNRGPRNRDTFQNETQNNRTRRTYHDDDMRDDDDDENDDEGQSKTNSPKPKGSLGLHYNIQVHLPATKDVEVYNAIFKSLKNHLLE